MRINQTELAKRLELSQRTVSAVLAGTGRISEATRKRVLEAAKKYGYVRNDLAMGLRHGKTHTIGMIWDHSDPWAGDGLIAQQLTPEIRKAGYSVSIADASVEMDVLLYSIDQMLARSVDALIIRAIPSHLKNPDILARLRQVKAVIALTREAIPDFPGDIIIHDRNASIEEVVAHLAQSGRKRPLMALDINEESNPPKLDAFRRACEKYGIGELNNLLLPLPRPDGPRDIGEAHRRGLCARFLDSIDTDAIFCFNDMGAMYIMRELQDRGMSVPDDIAVIGFNNSPIGKVWQPPLASGDRCPEAVSVLIDHLLKDRLSNLDKPYVQEVVPMKFIWRESAG